MTNREQIGVPEDLPPGMLDGIRDRYRARLDNIASRILAGIYAHGVDETQGYDDDAEDAVEAAAELIIKIDREAERNAMS